MSRIALILLGSALMLVVAACDSGGDDTDSESSVDNGTEETSDGSESGATEEAASEGDATEESSDDEATDEGEDGAESGDAEATQPAGEDTSGSEAEGTTTPEQTQPGQQEGMFFDLTAEEANEMTDFEVREPQEIPEGVEFQSIMGMASQQASEEERSENAATIIFSYAQPSEEEGGQPLPVELTQSSELDMSASLPPDTEQEQVTIGDREVTRVSVTDQSGNDVLAYMWDEGEIHYSLAAIMGPELEESELEDMLASIPAS